MDSFGTNITDNLSGLLGKQYPHKKLSRFSTEMRYGNFSLWLDGAFFFQTASIMVHFVEGLMTWSFAWGCNSCDNALLMPT